MSQQFSESQALDLINLEPNILSKFTQPPASPTQERLRNEKLNFFLTKNNSIRSCF